MSKYERPQVASAAKRAFVELAGAAPDIWRTRRRREVRFFHKSPFLLGLMFQIQDSQGITIAESALLVEDAGVNVDSLIAKIKPDGFPEELFAMQEPNLWNHIARTYGPFSCTAWHDNSIGTFMVHGINFADVGEIWHLNKERVSGAGLAFSPAVYKEMAESFGYVE